MRTMHKIAIINLKGGVGKSVTACNLACILGWKYSRRVLVMDLDKQANSSKFFKCFDPEEKSMADVLTLEAKLGDVIQIPDYKNFQFVDVAPSCMNMIFANQRLTLETMRPRHDRLRHALEQHREDYDYCVMDCPPDIDMATVNALVCADWVIIPVDCDKWACDGMQEIVEQIEQVQAYYNPRLKIMGALMTKYRRTRYAEDIIVQLCASGISVLETVIRYTVKVSEAAHAGMPLLEYCPDCTAAVDYRELTEEVERIVSNVDTKEG